MLHDCPSCVMLLEKFGTCEYMHEANPGKCTCAIEEKPKRKQHVQLNLNGRRFTLVKFRITGKTTTYEVDGEGPTFRHGRY